ncbi:MAG TPA: putative O-glycosylation ligase, exosortase A system-associated [Thermoanaerobaculia bacterium]|nr:putative O-glycosylation ligase, exosortase A system-associated [Thermoanaerobaculia bacterium]
MRDLVVLAIVFAALPVIVFRPYFGLLTYSWLAYMRPQDMAWGMSRVLPLSQWVALAMVAGIVVTFGRERLITVKLQTVLLILLGLWISVTVMTAVLPEMSQEVYGHYWKGILMALLTTGLVRDRERFRLLYLLIPFSIGFLGAKRGLFGLARGGIQYNDGPGGFMADNNSFAMMLNMMLPLLVGIATTDERRWVRITAASMAALCVPTILFTFSRGGLLTLCVVSALLIWRSKNRFVVAGLMALALIVFLAFTSATITDKYLDRASTIDNYQEDGSARGRLNAWKTSWYVFLDYPVFGVGPNNLAAVFRRYSPEVDRFRVAHNAYFQVLAESGLPALLLFLGAIGAALWRMERLRKATALRWVEIQARMLQISIIAYMTGSMFLNTAYNELIYHLIALTVCLEVVAHAQSQEATAVPAKAEDVPWWKRPAPAPGLTGMGRI